MPQVAREMLARHDWITPTLGGVPWLEKPPLYYWQAMLAYRLFGVSDWAARLPSVIDATLLVFAIVLVFAALSVRLRSRWGADAGNIGGHRRIRARCFDRHALGRSFRALRCLLGSHGLKVAAAPSSVFYAVHSRSECWRKGRLLRRWRPRHRRRLRRNPKAVARILLDSSWIARNPGLLRYRSALVCAGATARIRSSSTISLSSTISRASAPSLFIIPSRSGTTCQ